MKKIAFFAVAALSLTLASCSKEQMLSYMGYGDIFIMTLNADPGQPTKATFGADWKFAFSEGDKISLTNNQVTIPGTYYTLTRGSDGNFTGAVTAPESAANWYAYYPSGSVSLAGQTGTRAGAAAYYAYAGVQENVEAGSTSLSVTLAPKTAILVITNTMGAVDIGIRTSDGKWVSGLEAKDGAASFEVAKSDTRVSLFSSSATGVHYIVVPAGEQIAIYDGSTKVRETKAAGLSAGKYYNIAIAAPFSVSETRKIIFSPGNLFWDGDSFEFEESQYCFSTSREATHISHFYWSNDVSEALEYNGSSDTQPDYFFTNADDEKGYTPKPDFTVNGETGRWRTLSPAEWTYLLETRGGKTCSWVELPSPVSVNGLVLYPDGYTGELAEDSVPAGCVFLPAAGISQGTSVISDGSFGDYAASFSNDQDYATFMEFQDSGVAVYDESNHTSRSSNGYAVRLVADCE